MERTSGEAKAPHHGGTPGASDKEVRFLGPISYVTGNEAATAIPTGEVATFSAARWIGPHWRQILDGGMLG